MAFITHHHPRERTPISVPVKEIAMQIGFVILVVAAVPLALLALPFVLLSNHSLKEGEYWD
jgi:hypothetical protein